MPNNEENKLIEIYNFIGLNVRFEKRNSIVEIRTTGALTQDVKAQQSIDFNINADFTSSTDTKFIVLPMRRRKSTVQYCLQLCQMEF